MVGKWTKCEQLILVFRLMNNLKDSRQVYNSIKEKFGISYDEVKRTIRRRQREMLVNRMFSKPQDHLIEVLDRSNGKKLVRVYVAATYK